MDTLYWEYTLPEGEWANGWLVEIYDGYNETVAPLGYILQTDLGLRKAQLDANEARILYPGEYSSAALFSTTAIGVNINLYGAFGTPAGKKYQQFNQIWPVFVTFCSWLLSAGSFCRSASSNYSLIHTLQVSLKG